MPASDPKAPNWVPEIGGRSGALYRTIADALAEDVAAGRLPHGARLPTHRALAEALQVTVGTVTRAYAEAERRGLVDATVGRGTFVQAAADAPWPPSGAPEDPCFPQMRPVRWQEEVDARAGQAGQGDRGRVDLSVNYPAASYLAHSLLPGLDSLQDAARLTEVAGYQPSNGRAEHRAAGTRWLARHGLDASADDVLLVHGTQGGLTVALTTLARPGDTVLVEQLTWPGIQSLGQVNALRLAPVASDADGLEPDALREAARRTGARIVYCMPTLHNPTNVTMSRQRREALLQVAREEGLLLIEDDIYGFLAEDAPPPLAALDPERALYVTSLSKSVAPGLRIGFLKAPSSLVPRLAASLRATMLMVSSLSAEIAARLIDSGHAAAAAQAQKQEATARQALARQPLAGLSAETAPTSFHLWLPLPPHWSTADFVAEAQQRGVAVTPGTAFTVDGTDPHAVRLCLSAARDRKALERGLGVVAELAHTRPEAAMPVV